MTATILQFPQRNKGRVRRTNSARAEGLWAMHQYNTTADNIEIFNDHRISEAGAVETLGYAVNAILNTLPRDITEKIKRRARAGAVLGKTDGERIAATWMALCFNAL